MQRVIVRFLKVLAGIIVVLILGAFIFCVTVSDRYVVPIITYHSVDNTPNYLCPTVKVENFRRHMEFLKSKGFHIVTLDELVKGIREGKSLPRKSVVIAFDDGMDDNYAIAYPILKEYQFPAVMFVSSHFIGKDGYLTWNQLREMAKNGITIGSHSRYHKHIPDLTVEEQQQEIFESKKMLEEKLGIPVDYIAYPFGGFSDHIKDLVKAAGYKGACTTNRGRDRFNHDPYELNRIRMSDRRYGDFDLWLRFSGYYNFFRTLANPH